MTTRRKRKRYTGFGWWLLWIFASHIKGKAASRKCSNPFGLPPRTRTKRMKPPAKGGGTGGGGGGGTPRRATPRPAPKPEPEPNRWFIGPVGGWAKPAPEPIDYENGPDDGGFYPPDVEEEPEAEEFDLRDVGAAG